SMILVSFKLTMRWQRYRRRQGPPVVFFCEGSIDLEKFLLECFDSIGLLNPQTFQSGKVSFDAFCCANNCYCLSQVRAMREVPGELPLMCCLSQNKLAIVLPAGQAKRFHYLFYGLIAL